MPFDPQKLDEARRAYQQEESSGFDPAKLDAARYREKNPYSLTERAMAGISGKGLGDIQQPSGLDVGDVVQVGAGLALPTLLGGIGSRAGLPGLAAGTAAGTSLNMAIRQAIAQKRPDLAEPASPQETVGQTALSGGLAFAVPKAIEAAAPIAGAIASKSLAPLKSAGAKLYDYFATSPIAGGINKGAWEYFKGNVDSVLSKIGAGPEALDTAANGIRTAIHNSVYTLEEAYKAGAQKLGLSKTPIRIDLEKNLGATIRNIAGEDFGYLDPTRNADSPAAGFFIKNIVGRLQNMKAASPYDIYKFQRDLNSYIQDNIGTSLGAALQATKTTVRKFIEDHPQLASISGMNNAWTTAQTIESEASKLVRANDLVSYVQRVMRSPVETLEKRTLTDLSTNVPGVKEGISELLGQGTAQSIGPLFRTIPSTGYAAGLGAAALYGAQHVAQDPRTLLFSPALLGMSPYAYAMGYKYAPAMANALSRYAGTAFRSATPVYAPVLQRQFAR